ncbi:large-conductance mechanosensitive channel protein MscL [Bacillus sp. 31A1R]|uniref:Large-conductance mechanosensitive channel n=1 Tax=Robertmurraya mangrovi TaxID=3098077 RepID=A0ABU5J2H5_9BACI|nr:large-conductance mechanosensitive channel protein MscL [Bacillus sp. 31A1R]MDZ5473561.1 large-conductance mechanosensitive channel protein MscL [Bacillus sp. 31A1R]
MLNEFKKFALKGNVLDLAVGVVIGGAFGKIVTSLVNDIIMPLLGLLVGGVNFTTLQYVYSREGEEPVVLKYGQFIQTTFDFIIIAFSIFIFIKAINSFKKKEEETKPAEPPTPSKEEILLAEIRDILKQKETENYKS